MKKLVSILMAAVLLLCAGAAMAEGQTYTVGICQLVTHDALDAATQGFMDALTEELGDAVTFDVQNAAGDSNTCSTIVNSFVAADVDLILANATAALQAAVAATADIPILGTSVTEYGVALDIDDFGGTVGGNVSGTSDLAPLDQQAAMLQTLFPDAKNVGLLYCSAEANSQYQVDTVKGYLEEMGYTCTLYPFADSNDAAAVTQTAALDPKTAAKVLETTERIIQRDHLTTLMITHNMRDAIAHGNRLIMMYDGRIVVDVSGEEKRRLTVEDLLALFEKASGQALASDRMLLG